MVAARLRDVGAARAGEAVARLCRRRWGQAAAELRGVSVSGLGRLWCARKRGVGRRERGSRRAAAATQRNGSGTVWNERGNLVNVEKQGEHELQCIT